MSNKHPQSVAELKAHLEEQIKFLEKSAASFDKGFEGESKRLATTIRVLLHDTRNSTSLLNQLGMKELEFISTCIKHNPSNISTQNGLIQMAMGEHGVKWVPFLDETVSGNTEMLFDEWWNEVVIVDNTRHLFTRKQLVLAMANQDGGSHIDPELDEHYGRLSRKNSIGWEPFSHKINKVNLTNPEKTSIRQIAHEILRTIKPDYPQQKPVTPPHSVLIAGIEIAELGASQMPLTQKKEASKKLRASGLKVARNKPCPCGSGQKYKRCCGGPER